QRARRVGVRKGLAAGVVGEDMEFLARHYCVLTIQDVLLILRGTRSMPRKAVAVTFDDGYADNAEVAAPVLGSVGVPGAFYLTVDSIASGASPWFCHLRHAFFTTTKIHWMDYAGYPRLLLDAAARESALLTASEHIA